MSTSKRTVDLLVEGFDLNRRRKYVLKNENGETLLDLYFKPITRSDRMQAAAFSNSSDALDLSTHMLCQKAELKDGTKAFAHADAIMLQKKLPESVLNELELFLFGVNEETDLAEAKND